jgi:ribosome-binding protein aMBF1 (putative translation factor)
MPKKSEQSFQDWEKVVLTKKSTEKKSVAQVDEKVVRDSRLDNNEQGTLRHRTCGKEFGKAMQKARLDKNMSQKMLANALNVKQCVIADYESGKAIVKDSRFINKCQTVLVVKLPLVKK